MREINKISEDLFDKIRSRFENVSVGNENAKSTSNPEDARFFNFDFVNEAGHNYGNVTISLIDENSLKIYFGKNITAELQEDEKEEWYDFLRGMRHFAKRNLLSFDTRDITRSNLKLRDLEQVSKSDSTFNTDEVNVNKVTTESRLFGSSRSSYQTVGPVRLIVRHSDHVDETVHGARTRNIEAIFVETHLGERFLMPFKKLSPARAMARHLSNGGKMHDELGEHITEMVTEMSGLSVFVRKMRNRTFEDAETIGMIEAAVERYSELHQCLGEMRGQRGYQSFVENFIPDTTIMEDDFDIDSLKERFVKKIFDDRLSEALPHVYRAYMNKKKNRSNDFVAEFEDWTTRVTEGTWATPEQDEEKEELKSLMEKPLRAGPNGEDASGALYDIIGSDSLFDSFYEASQSEEGPETDVRPLVIDWLNENGYPEMAEELGQVMQQQQTPADATQPQPGQLTPQANQQAPQSPPVQNPASTGVMPAQESKQIELRQLRRLAGLK